MPNPDAREPLEGPRPSDSSDAPGGGRGKSARPDLSAVPAFLRGRASASDHVPANGHPAAPTAPSVADVAALPMLGVAPRRLLLLGASILLAWLVVSFGRQVAEASAASSRAEELRAANAALATEVAAMEEELQLIQDQRFISQAARAFRLGTPGEVPFALEAGAPELPPDAPGSAAVSLGAETSARSPLESWLEVLFGPGD